MRKLLIITLFLFLGACGKAKDTTVKSDSFEIQSTAEPLTESICNENLGIDFDDFLKNLDKNLKNNNFPHKIIKKVEGPGFNSCSKSITVDYEFGNIMFEVNGNNQIIRYGLSLKLNIDDDEFITNYRIGQEILLYTTNPELNDDKVKELQMLLKSQILQLINLIKSGREKVNGGIDNYEGIQYFMIYLKDGLSVIVSKSPE